jgi:hypothetical protein
MTAFILGVPLPVNTTSMPASGSTASNRPGYLPSRSRMRNRARHPASSRSMTRFLTACLTHEELGCAVAPSTLTRRVRCSITASTYTRARQRDRLQEVARRQRIGLRAQEARPGAGSSLGCGVDAASLRISHTVQAATFTPRTCSSPWTRRYPPGQQSVGGGPRSRRLCPDRSTEAGAAPRTGSSPSDRPVSAAQPDVMPAATPSSRPFRHDLSPLGTRRRSPGLHRSHQPGRCFGNCNVHPCPAGYPTRPPVDPRPSWVRWWPANEVGEPTETVNSCP